MAGEGPHFIIVGHNNSKIHTVPPQDHSNRCSIRTGKFNVLLAVDIIIYNGIATGPERKIQIVTRPARFVLNMDMGLFCVNSYIRKTSDSRWTGGTVNREQRNKCRYVREFCGHRKRK